MFFEKHFSSGLSLCSKNFVKKTLILVFLAYCAMAESYSIDFFIGQSRNEGWFGDASSSRIRQSLTQNRPLFIYISIYVLRIIIYEFCGISPRRKSCKEERRLYDFLPFLKIWINVRVCWCVKLKLTCVFKHLVKAINPI